MRLLVTGGAGFIGSHFIRRWLEGHAQDGVVNLDLLTYAGSPERLAMAGVEGSARYRFVQGDICDIETVRAAMEGCDAVVHFAAETHVDRSITDAVPFLRTNVEGTYGLIQEARAKDLRLFIHVSTDEVYGPVLEGAVDESAPLSPRSPYAASKASGDWLVQACHETFTFPGIIVRPTNIFGPGQYPEKFIPLCITHGLEKKSVPLYGDGQQRRNWLFVDDLCEALQVIIERGKVGEVYNVASGHEEANLQTARQLLALLGQSPKLIERVPDRPGHDRRYAMYDGKVRALGWEPTRPFAKALEETVAWYRDHGAWWRPLAKRLDDHPYHWLNRPPGTGVVSAARADR